MELNIRKISNGYILTDSRGAESFYGTCAQLFAALLLHLDSRCEHFGGSSFGAVFVASKPGEKYTAPEEAIPV
jgi:hypothetical protein